MPSSPWTRCSGPSTLVPRVRLPRLLVPGHARLFLFPVLTLLPSIAAYISAHPPESAQTDISLSQYLAIQEKGVSAWEFEPELETANCFVEARTEIEFFDLECTTVMSNLPVPKQNEVYYWEAKIYEKTETSLVSIGMATKPYPLFRLPGKRVCVAHLCAARADSGQVSTVPLLHISRPATGDTTNPSHLPPTARSTFKAMLLGSATGQGREQSSSRATGRNWRTWCTA